jgi:quercetin dioxygenase-like cupin family protein
MSTPLAGTIVLADHESIDELPWGRLPALGRGVSHKELWRSGQSVAGLMRLEPGGYVDEHVHRRAQHHLWVLDGTVRILDRDLGPGSYAHVPPGVDHGMRDGGAGSTFVYLYIQPDA